MPSHYGKEVGVLTDSDMKKMVKSHRDKKRKGTDKKKKDTKEKSGMEKFADALSKNIQKKNAPRTFKNR